MRTDGKSISVPGPLYERMQAAAAQRGGSIAGLLIEACAPVLEGALTREQVKDLVRRAQQREFDTFVEGRNKQAAGLRAAWAGRDRPPSLASQLASRRRRKNYCSRCSRTGHNAGRKVCPPP